MLNSAEHEILPANKQQITDKYSFAVVFLLSLAECKFSMLMNVKMPTFVGIFIFISRENFMVRSW